LEQNATTCACECPPTTCTAPEVLDPESCRCGCYNEELDQYSNCNMATEVLCCPGFGCVDPGTLVCCAPNSACAIGNTRCCGDGICSPIGEPCPT